MEKTDFKYNVDLSKEQENYFLGLDVVVPEYMFEKNQMNYEKFYIDIMDSFDTYDILKYYLATHY